MKAALKKQIEKMTEEELEEVLRKELSWANDSSEVCYNKFDI